MDSSIDRLTCGREEELVGFLYRELDEVQAQTFRRHMQDCASCSSEVIAFRNVRQSVIDWRNESLSAQSHVALGRYIPTQRRSAVAAVREFFSLSPVWMKAAVGFASVLFCIFAVLAVSGLRKTPSPIAATAGGDRPSIEDINAMVERRVQDELKRRNAPPELAAPKTDQNSPAVLVSATNNRKRVANPLRPDARRPLTRVEREQLAADLRLIPGTNDIELELLDDAINQ